MSRRDFILLAEYLRRVDPRSLPNFDSTDERLKGRLRQHMLTVRLLADFCGAYSPHFDRQRWIRSVEGSDLRAEQTSSEST